MGTRMSTHNPRLTLTVTTSKTIMLATTRATANLPRRAGAGTITSRAGTTTNPHSQGEGVATTRAGGTTNSIITLLRPSGGEHSQQRAPRVTSAQHSHVCRVARPLTLMFTHY